MRKAYLLDYLGFLSSLLSLNFLFFGFVFRCVIEARGLWRKLLTSLEHLSDYPTFPVPWSSTQRGLCMMLRGTGLPTWSCGSCVASTSSRWRPWPVTAWPGSFWRSVLLLVHHPNRLLQAMLSRCRIRSCYKEKDVRNILFMVHRSLNYTYIGQ